jgi:hypothetical protein
VFSCEILSSTVSQVIFSDETYVDVSPPRPHFVRHHKDHRIQMQHTTQHRPFLQRILFWGAIYGGGPLPLVPVNGTMTGLRYRSILAENLVPFLEEQPLAHHFMFQQDNAPSHTAAATMAFLQNNGVEVIQWPPYSPDLNCIENLWGFIKNKLSHENITTKEELIRRVQNIWQSQDMKDICYRMIHSMPRRIAMCIRNRGDYTKY